MTRDSRTDDAALDAEPLEQGHQESVLAVSEWRYGLEDEELRDEIELLSIVMARANEQSEHLSIDEIDRLLGVIPHVLPTDERAISAGPTSSAISPTVSGRPRRPD